MARRIINYTQAAQGIVSMPFFPPSFCELALARIRRLGWEAAQVHIAKPNGRDGSYTRLRTRSASILNSARAEEVYRKFDRQINRLAKPVISQVWNVKLKEHSGTQLIRYRQGGHYLPHADAADDFAERYFTVVCYLNDDFAGGHTSFPSLEARVKPKTGQAIIFPARYVHCAEPVTNGEKFVLLTWVCGPVAINWI
jgi:predicted 2-oxoglutarate/Fe(II)-dependent dioxygenase YbiX